MIRVIFFLCLLTSCTSLDRIDVLDTLILREEEVFVYELEDCKPQKKYHLLNGDTVAYSSYLTSLDYDIVNLVVSDTVVNIDTIFHRADSLLKSEYSKYDKGILSTSISSDRSTKYEIFRSSDLYQETKYELDSKGNAIKKYFNGELLHYYNNYYNEEKLFRQEVLNPSGQLLDFTIYERGINHLTELYFAADSTLMSASRTVLDDNGCKKRVSYFESDDLSY